MKRKVAAGGAVLLILLCMAWGAGAVGAFPGEQMLEDTASGGMVRGYWRGDERFSYCVDTSGRVLETDAAGCLRYVVHDGDGYALGGYLIAANGDTAVGGLPVMEGDAGLQGELQALRERIAALRPRPMADGVQALPPDYDPLSDRRDALYGRLRQYADAPQAEDYAARGGEIPLLVIKLRYDDVACAFDDAAWSRRIFDEGLTSYYREVSNGAFTYVPARESGGTPDDGVVEAYLPISCPRYSRQHADLEPGLYEGGGKTYAISGTPMLFAYAVAAVEDQVNFAAYDRNGDGRIDPTELAIMLALPGLSAAMSSAQADGQPGAWPHSSILHLLRQGPGGAAGAYLLRVRVDGVELYKYTMVAENIGLANHASFPNVRQPYDYYHQTGDAELTTIGTVCHELAHDLGLKDLYNTVGSMTGRDPGSLSLMSTGSWGAGEGEMPGARPTHLDAFSKLYLGFYTAQEAEPNGVYALYAASDSSRYNVLRVPTRNASVYYLVESRQFSGFDAGMYAEYIGQARGQLRGGAVIWRIDERAVERYWAQNEVNAHTDAYGVMPLALTGDPDMWAESPWLKLAMKPVAVDSPVAKELRVIEDGSANTPVILGLLSGASAADVPNTGDSSHAPLWLAMLAACAAGLALELRRRRAAGYSAEGVRVTSVTTGGLKRRKKNDG